MSSRSRAAVGAVRIRRRRLIAGGAAALGAAGLAGCGFRPLYGETAGGNGGDGGGTGGRVADALATVQVGVIADRPGQLLRGYLLERLNPAGRPAAPAYRLRVELDESRQALATAADDTVTRSRLLVTADYSLTDLAEDTVVLERSHRAVTSFNIQDDLFGSRVSVESARDRSLVDISEQVRRDLALFFQRTP